MLSAFRSSQSSTLRAPLNKRFFTPSTANMVIKTYFDVSWYGPEVQVNDNGDITSKGAEKGKLPLAGPQNCIAITATPSCSIATMPVEANC